MNGSLAVSFTMARSKFPISLHWNAAWQKHMNLFVIDDLIGIMEFCPGENYIQSNNGFIVVVANYIMNPVNQVIAIMGPISANKRCWRTVVMPDAFCIRVPAICW